MGLLLDITTIEAAAAWPAKISAVRPGDHAPDYAGEVHGRPADYAGETPGREIIMRRGLDEMRSSRLKRPSG